MRTAAMVGLIAFAVYWSTLRIPLSGDATTHVHLAYSFVFDGDADLVEFAGVEPPLAANTLADGERIHSPYVPGNAALFAPLALAAGTAGIPAASLAASGVLAKSLAAALTATAMALLYLVLRSVGSRRIALALAFASAFATYALSNASQVYMQHGATLALVTLALLGVRGGRPWLAGLALGLAFAVRPMNGLFALAILGYYADQPRTALRAGLWMLPGLAFVGTYDWVVFGSPFRLPGARVELGSPLEGVLGNLVSPSRGLLVYSPHLAGGLLALAAAWAWRGGREVRLLRAGSLAVAGALLLFGTYVDWHGGWTYGNRYVADALPFLALGLAVAAARGWARSRAAVAVFVAAATWGLVVHAAGASLYYFYWRGRHWDATPDVTTTPARLWDWTDAQWQWVLARASSEPDASLAVLAAALAAAALAFAARAGVLGGRGPRSGAACHRPHPG